MKATEYNSKNVGLFAPAGFPKVFSGLVDPAPYDSPEFAEQIVEYQSRLGLKADGFCGPATIAAMASFDYGSQCHAKSTKIIIGPRAIDIGVPTLTYLDDFTIGDTATRTRRRKVTQIVTHYDVSFNARATEAILEKRGYSTHFTIDGDDEGTVYQFHDPATRVAFHAKGANEHGIGIDINNPADPKYRARDEGKRGRSREVVEASVHGGTHKRLTYFDEQLASYSVLVRELCEAFDIPLVYPMNEHGEPILGTIDNPEGFRGVVGHYHLTARKTDPAPLDWSILD